MDLKSPEIAKGSFIPDSMIQKQLEEAREKDSLRKQRKHDFLVATYGIIGGIVSGVISSLIVLYLQGLLSW